MGWIKSKNKDYPIPEQFRKNKRYNVLFLGSIYSWFYTIKDKVLDLGKYFTEDYWEVRKYANRPQKRWSREQYIEHMASVDQTLASNLKMIEEIRQKQQQENKDD